jgi:hypothetical protein
MPYKNKEDLYKAQERQRNKNHNSMWDILLSSPCLDCGNNDPRVLEFDHRPEEKKEFNISRAVSGSTRSWQSIKREIDKCDIVCSNCHKIRTMERGNYKRNVSYNKPL